MGYEYYGVYRTFPFWMIHEVKQDALFITKIKWKNEPSESINSFHLRGDIFNYRMPFDLGGRIFANKTFANGESTMEFRQLAKVRWTFSIWRNSRRCVGESEMVYLSFYGTILI